MSSSDDHFKARKIWQNIRERVNKLDGMTSSGMSRRISIYREGIRRLLPYAAKGVTIADIGAAEFSESLSRALVRRDALKASGH